MVTQEQMGHTTSEHKAKVKPTGHFVWIKRGRERKSSAREPISE